MMEALAVEMGDGWKEIQEGIQLRTDALMMRM